jgi:primosomal protein N' (replication factor Y)
MPAPKICPNCNASYIRYLGVGTEKVESELSRIFPQARIRRLEKADKLDTFDGAKPRLSGRGLKAPLSINPEQTPTFKSGSVEWVDLKDADIFIATQAIFKEGISGFDLIGVLSIDNSLNRIDLRSAEKTFSLLLGLTRLTEKKIIIQTHLSHHHCFRALENKNPDIFYDVELKYRKELGFVPFKHLGLIKIRSKLQAKSEEAAKRLFEALAKANAKNSIKVLSVSAGNPQKLRNTYYWQVLLSANNPVSMAKFIKNRLKEFLHSGIIVTVDIDPV